MGVTQHQLTRRMRVALEVSVQQLERLRREAGAAFAFLRRLDADEIGQVRLAGFVAVPVAGERSIRYTIL